MPNISSAVLTDSNSLLVMSVLIIISGAHVTPFAPELTHMWPPPISAVPNRRPRQSSLKLHEPCMPNNTRSPTDNQWTQLPHRTTVSISITLHHQYLILFPLILWTTNTPQRMTTQLPKGPLAVLLQWIPLVSTQALQVSLPLVKLLG